MKILVIAMNYAPELTGIGKYVGEMCEWLAGEGHAVSVVTAPPYYPAWRIGAGHSGRRYRRETLAGVRVIRCPLYVPAHPRGLARLVHLASFALSSAPVIVLEALRLRADRVFVVEPPLACVPAAALAARLCGAELQLHVQDFELDAAFELGMLRGRLLRRIATAAERWLMRRCDRVSTISQRMLELLAHKGVAAERRALFPNWVDLERIRPLPAAESLRTEFGIAPDRPVLLYSGNFGAKQGLELLVAAAHALAPRSDALFLLCGDGPLREALMQAAAGLANVRFLPLQPRAQLNALLNTADVHLLPQRVDVEDLVMPSKLAGMMASGRPVVATARAGTELADAVAHGGRVVAPGDVPALCEAILALLADPAARARLGEGGRAYALQQWDQRRVLQRAFPSPPAAGALPAPARVPTPGVTQP